jgi:hypothetical protein
VQLRVAFGYAKSFWLVARAGLPLMVLAAALEALAGIIAMGLR